MEDKYINNLYCWNCGEKDDLKLQGSYPSGDKYKCGICDEECWGTTES